MMPTKFVPQPGDSILRGCQKKYRARPTQNNWKAFRNDKGCGERAVNALRVAYGSRCLYCDHAHGWTIDHAKPKAARPSMRFSWANWRLSCMDCNNKKGTKCFVDPVRHDPHDYLEFDLVTGAPIAVGSGRRKAAANNAKDVLDNQTLNEARRAARMRMVELLGALSADARIRADGKRMGTTRARDVAAMLDPATPHRAILRDLILEEDPVLNPHRALVDEALKQLPMLEAWARKP